MRTTLSIIILLGSLMSCNKNEPIESGCDCQGPSNYVLKNEVAVYKRTSIRILSKQIDPTYCNPIFLQGKASENDTVYVSGIIRGSCVFSDEYLPKIEVTAFRKE